MAVGDSDIYRILSPGAKVLQEIRRPAEPKCEIMQDQLIMSVVNTIWSSNRPVSICAILKSVQIREAKQLFGDLLKCKAGANIVANAWTWYISDFHGF